MTRHDYVPRPRRLPDAADPEPLIQHAHLAARLQRAGFDARLTRSSYNQAMWVQPRVEVVIDPDDPEHRHQHLFEAVYRLCGRCMEPFRMEMLSASYVAITLQEVPV